MKEVVMAKIVDKAASTVSTNSTTWVNPDYEVTEGVTINSWNYSFISTYAVDII